MAVGMLDNVVVEVGDGSPVDMEEPIEMETSADGEVAAATEAAPSAHRNWAIRIADKNVRRVPI